MERLTGKFRGRTGLVDYLNVSCNKICNRSFCEDCPIEKAFEKLAHYEDLEEQGLLQELPCKIGADVYSIPSKVNFDLNVLSGHKENNRVYHQKITNIVFTENGWYMTGHLDMEYGTGRIFLDKFYKETWFLTKEEAEAKLKELENE